MKRPTAAGSPAERREPPDHRAAGAALPGPAACGRSLRAPGQRLCCEQLEARLTLAGDGIEPGFTAADLTAAAPTASGGTGQVEQVVLVGDPSGSAAAHRVTLARSGFLDVSLAAGAGVRGDRQLQLRDAAGTLVATSVEGAEGVKLSQYLPAGDYDLALAAPPGAVGTCTIIDTPAEPPGPLALGQRPVDVVIDDVNRDRVPDLVAKIDTNDSSVSEIVVFLGIPDAIGRPTGRFFPRVSTEFQAGASAMGPIGGPAPGGGRAPVGVVAVQATSVESVVSIASCDIDGRFATVQSLAVGGDANGVVLADVDGDRTTDILLLHRPVFDFSPSYVTILWGAPDGRFSAERSATIPIEFLTSAVVVADVTGDSRADIVTAGRVADATDAGRVDVIVGPADWRTSDPAALGRGSTRITGFAPMRLAAGDFDRDGRLDIVTAGVVLESGGQSGGVAVVRVAGGNASAPAVVASSPLYLPSDPQALAVADVDRDGRLDVVTADGGANTASVLLGDGSGGVGMPIAWRAGDSPTAIALGDLDGDDRIDIVTADENSRTVTVLPQRPDGSYAATPRTDVGDDCSESATADFNGDGRIDVVTVNESSADLSVLLGTGDGGFLPQRRYPLGGRPISLAVGDLNRDGRPDIVVTRRTDSACTILLGIGDGSFDRRPDLMVEGLPYDVAVADVDSDGWNDIVATTTGDGGVFGQVTVAYGGPEAAAYSRRFTRTVGIMPIGVLVADVTDDGRPDLVVLNQGDGSAENGSRLAILRGSAGEKFAATRWVDTGGRADGMTATDIPGAGRTGIALTLTAETGRRVAVISRMASGGFGETRSLPLPADPSPAAPIAADMDGDGRDDIVIGAGLLPDSGEAGAIVIGSQGGFVTPRSVGGGGSPWSLAAADFNGDGRNDLLFTNSFSPLVVGLAMPDGTFAPIGPGTFADRIANRVVLLPAAAGFPGGTAALDRSGAIRVRLDGGLAPVLAAGAGTAFDLAVVGSLPEGATIATIDGDRRGVSLRAVRPDGSLGPLRSLPLPPVDGRQPVLSRISSIDLDGDGNDDLVVSDPGSGVIRVLPAAAAGGFTAAAWQAYVTGAGGSRFTLADVGGDGRPDLLVADQVAGDVSVRPGLPAGGQGGPLFGPERRFRATLRDAAFAVDPLTRRNASVSPGPIGDVAVADVDGDGRADILVTSPADRAFAVLAGLPGGGFAAPRIHLPRAISGPGPLLIKRSAAPEELVVGDFDADGSADVAILDRTNAEILVYRSSAGSPAAGRKASPDFDAAVAPIPLAGSLPTSLAAADLSGPSGKRDRVADLIVGNDYGDVLVLPAETDARGRGTGRFARGVRADRGVALAATDIDGDGTTDFVYGDRALDRVEVSAGSNATMFAADRSLGVLGPSAVATAAETVGGRRLATLVVANGAGNEVLVFPRNAQDGDAFLPPRRIFVGTNPTGLVVADVNGDGTPDAVVTNGGSADISILLGATGADGRWTLVAGPRLAAGGVNPTALAVGDFLRADGTAGADGITDIAVTGRGASQVSLIPGVGAGFFAEAAIRGLDLPAAAAPTALFAVPRSGGAAGLLSVNSGAGSISAFDVSRGFARTDFGSGGASPRAAAIYSQAGTTALAVSNAGSSNLSVFLASPGSMAFAAVASSPFANAAALAFDSTGQLFGAATGGSSPLLLYSFSQATSDAGVTAAGLRALINFLPTQFSTVGLVATLVTSAGIQVTGDEGRETSATGGGTTAGRTGDAESLGGEGEAGEPVADDSSKPDPEVAETDLAPVMRLFLDAEATLRATNRRLIETLLSHAADPLELLSAAVAGVTVATAEPPPDEQPRDTVPPPAPDDGRRSVRTPSMEPSSRDERVTASDPHRLPAADGGLPHAPLRPLPPAAWRRAVADDRHVDHGHRGHAAAFATRPRFGERTPDGAPPPPPPQSTAGLLDAVFALVGSMTDGRGPGATP